MIDPLIRQEIRYRHSLGESERSIARVLGISRNTVHAYLTDETRGMQLRAPRKENLFFTKLTKIGLNTSLTQLVGIVSS